MFLFLSFRQEHAGVCKQCEAFIRSFLGINLMSSGAFSVTEYTICIPLKSCHI